MFLVPSTLLLERHIYKGKQIHVGGNFFRFIKLKFIYAHIIKHTPASPSNVLYVCPNIPTFVELLKY